MKNSLRWRAGREPSRTTTLKLVPAVKPPAQKAKKRPTLAEKALSEARSGHLSATCLATIEAMAGMTAPPKILCPSMIAQMARLGRELGTRVTSLHDFAEFGFFSITLRDARWRSTLDAAEWPLREMFRHASFIRQAGPASMWFAKVGSLSADAEGEH